MLEFFIVTIKVKTAKGEETREYSIIAPNEEFVREKFLKAYVDQFEAVIEKLEKQECFVMRTK